MVSFVEFNKKLYWKNRKNKERGQGSKIEGVFYPKGKDVEGALNGIGEHLVRVKGKGLQYLNRKEVRNKSTSNPATKKNYQHQVKTYGVIHLEGKKVLQKSRLPGISNHTAHRERQINRQAIKEAKT